MLADQVYCVREIVRVSRLAVSCRAIFDEVVGPHMIAMHKPQPGAL